MRRITMAIAASGVILGSLAGAGAANAASVNNTNTAPVAPHTTPVPVIAALGCFGGVGLDGCGPGWIFRDGWRGFSCYPC